MATCSACRTNGSRARGSDTGAAQCTSRILRETDPRLSLFPHHSPRPAATSCYTLIHEPLMINPAPAPLYLTPHHIHTTLLTHRHYKPTNPAQIIALASFIAPAPAKLACAVSEWDPFFCGGDHFVAMAAKGLALVFLGLYCFGSLVAAFEKEVKPNNYPNFEFHESSKQETPEVKPEGFGEFSFSETTTPGAQSEREYKPNNYKDFKFTEKSPVQGYGESEERVHDRFAKGQYNEYDASDKFGNHESFSAQDEVVYDARRQETREVAAAKYKTGEPEYRGSDATGRYPSSYELINAREHGNEAGYESLASNEVRFTNVHNTKADAEPKGKIGHSAPVTVHTEGHGGSSRYYTPSSDPDFAFRFAKPDSSVIGDNEFRVNNQETVSPQFNFDNSDATNDPTATYGTTTPVLAVSNVQKGRSSVSASGHGCANMYWAEHTKVWPSFFNVNTLVSQAFGPKAGDVYGTTALLQALYDNRDDGYSQLLSHGTAALMNAYAMPSYGLRHDAVIDQFLSALSSRTTAGVQATKFLNANHAYGPNECLN